MNIIVIIVSIVIIIIVIIIIVVQAQVSLYISVTDLLTIQTKNDKIRCGLDY